MSGAPKVRALEIIDELESERRGDLRRVRRLLLRERIDGFVHRASHRGGAGRDDVRSGGGGDRRRQRSRGRVPGNGRQGPGRCSRPPKRRCGSPAAAARPDVSHRNASMYVLIDNYDSFTWNLWHYLEELGAFRRGSIGTTPSRSRTCSTANQRESSCRRGRAPPTRRGICLELVRAAAGRTPVLGSASGTSPSVRRSAAGLSAPGR